MNPLSFIASSQNKDGSFGSSTPFYTSLILLCLRHSKDKPAVLKIVEKGIGFLLSERSPAWTWNYWRADSVERTTKACPDDLDDTSLALAAISLFAPEHNTGEMLASLTTALIQTEVETGGPYNTWVVPRALYPTWKDIDNGVNCNIAFLLGIHGIHLPSIENMIDKTLESGTLISSYYEPVFILYFIARCYKGTHAKRIIEKIYSLRNNNTAWANPLETAAALSSLLLLGADPDLLKDAVDTLHAYASTERWEEFPVYLEGDKDGKKYGQLRAVTAAFIYEALDLYKQSSRQSVTPLFAKEKDDALMRIKQKWATRPDKLRDDMYATSDLVLKNDKLDQILLLPYHFAHALSPDLRKRIPADLPSSLLEANLYGWIAYKIYDGLLDDEGDVSLLPTANTCLRDLVCIYTQLLPEEGLHYFNEVIDRLEAANAWERTHSLNALPDYGDYSVLAEKSLGHALGPMALLFKLGYSVDSNEVRGVYDFFKHYLIARQINDDAHDWLPDLKRGFINSAAAKLIGDMRIMKDISAYEDILRNRFWKETIDNITGDILYHVKKAERALAEIPIIEDPIYLLSLLKPLRNAAERALSEKARVQGFLSSYRF